MTLTEEQRDALEYAIDSLHADACDAIRDAKHGVEIRAENQNKIEILRAMIDSGEHFTDASKMPGFDLEKARACAVFVEPKEAFLEALDEIERLRVALLKSDNSNRIRRGITEGQDGLIVELDDKIQKQAARIKELEDALSEYQRLGKTIAGRVPCLVPHGDCGRCSADPREVCGALEQIAEGKIGPDAKPRSWQITDERKATLSASLKVLERLKKNNTDTDHSYLDRGITVLRDMLEEAE